MLRSIRSIRLAAATIVAATAACSDSPTAPVAGAVRDDAPSAAIMRQPPRTATLQVSSKIQGMAIPRTTVVFSSAAGSAAITDNGAGDQDSRIGYFKVNLASSTNYTAKVVQVLDGVWWLFPTNVVNGGQLVGTTGVEFGVLNLRSYPAFRILAKSTYGQLLPGATFHLAGPAGSGLNLYMYDTGAASTELSFEGQRWADGRLQWIVTKPGTWTVCETAPPTGGWLLAYQSCRTVEMTDDALTTIVFEHATPILLPGQS